KTWATVLAETNDIVGVLMLGHTLRIVATRYPFTAIMTSRMQQDGDIIRLFKVAGITIQRTGYESLAHYSDDQRPQVQRQKLQAITWSLLDYQRVVLLSPSQIALKNIDQLMDMPTEKYGNVLACLASLACTCTLGGPNHSCPIISPPTLFPSSQALPHQRLSLSTVVLKPDSGVFNFLRHQLFPFASTSTSIIDNVVRNNWKLLDWCYNAAEKMQQFHPTLWNEELIRIIDYGAKKPWMSGRNPTEYRAVEGKWWERYNELKAEWQTTRERKWLWAQVWQYYQSS
ncbi:hypothetical protein QBC43DRAFT_199462, partial [Cladorrhinum sp. PSN259]